MLNALDRAIGFVAPRVALRRAQYRQALAYYDAATPSRLRKGRTAPGTGNLSVARAGRNLREQARYLEQNHDLARGILADLVMKTIGPMGIVCEPQPRTVDGEIHDGFATDLLEVLKDWGMHPEVTWQHDWPSCQRLLARSWFRDGEVFAQMIAGLIPTLDHGTTIPFSLEMIEADLVPLEYSASPNIIQGIELSAWGRPRGYWTLLQAPGDIFIGSSASVLQSSQMKRISADRMLHIKSIDRIRQLRGVSVFATVLQRLDDLKDYEESERIAAKVAASMAAFIKKGMPDMYAEDSGPETGTPEGMRDMKFRPGMIFDELRPGEDIGIIDAKRPNPNLLPYRQANMRAVGSGTGTSYSAIAKSYDGTYSAQRQELVNDYAAYATCSAEFTAAIVRPTIEMAIALAVASGVVKVPRNVIPATIDDAIYIAPQMPWIDPESEMNAAVLSESAGYASAPEIIRRLGRSPRDVIVQESRWRRQCKDADLLFTPQANSTPDPAKTAARKGAAA